jgi:hypothetical protein
MEKLRKKSDITKKYLERLDGRNHINHPISFGFSHWSNVPGFHAPWMDGFRHFKKKQLEAIEIPSGINVYIAMENHHV